MRITPKTIATVAAVLVGTVSLLFLVAAIYVAVTIAGMSLGAGDG